MKKAFAIGLAALLSTSVFAQGYAGFDLGQGKLSDPDLKGTGFNVYGGYRMNESLGFEAGYRRILSDNITVYSTKVNAKVNGFQASVLGFLPLGQDVALFGRLGVNRLSAKATSSGGSSSDSDTKALVGVGLDYAMSKEVALRAEFQKPASDVQVLSVGLKFNF